MNAMCSMVAKIPTHNTRYRNKDREIEDIEEKHQDEIKVYKQKLKLLMYEQHVHLSEVQVSELCIETHNEQQGSNLICKCFCKYKYKIL